jgi:hypothetical protein
VIGSLFDDVRFPGAFLMPLNRFRPAAEELIKKARRALRRRKPGLAGA